MLSGGGALHAMLMKRVDPNGVPFDEDAELEALRSRLSVYRLLKIAYNSGAQRKQRRARAIRGRRFIAGVTRLLTKDLPDLARNSRDKFLERSLDFPNVHLNRVSGRSCVDGSVASSVTWKLFRRPTPSAAAFPFGLV